MSDDLLKTGGRILYAGVGNLLRGDDGVGCFIAAGIQARDGIHVCIAGEATDMIYHTALGFMPERVIIFDACDMGAEAGALKMLKPDEISDGSMSTHKMPLSMICRLIIEDTGADVYLAAVQPVSTEPESEMTDAVRECAGRVLGIINGSIHGGERR